MQEADPIRAFVAECLAPAPGESVMQREVYEVYRAWASQNGRGELSSAKMASRLAEAGIAVGVTSGRKMVRGQRLAMAVSLGELVPVEPAGTPGDPLGGLLGAAMRAATPVQVARPGDAL